MGKITYFIGDEELITFREKMKFESVIFVNVISVIILLCILLSYFQKYTEKKYGPVMASGTRKIDTMIACGDVRHPNTINLPLSMVLQWGGSINESPLDRRIVFANYQNQRYYNMIRNQNAFFVYTRRLITKAILLTMILNKRYDVPPRLKYLLT